MANTISQQTTQGNPKSIRRVPQPDSHRLFTSRIPHARNKHEGRISAGFGRSSQRSEDSESFEVRASGLDYEENTP